MFFAIQTVKIYFRYIPSTKPAEVPTNANARQNQIVAQQVHILKTTINHLKNAYNGNDIEWSDTGKLIHVISLYTFTDECFLPSTEDSDDTYESGSGDGSGTDDDPDDDESSGEKKRLSFQIHILTEHFAQFSGLDPYPDEDHPAIIPPHIPIDPSRTNVHEINRNDLEHSPETPGDPDITEQSRETKTSAGSSSSSREWRTKRLIITYFLPIVMAWFGGSISGAVADLL